MPRLTPIALALSLISFQQIALAQSSDTTEKTQTLETVDVKSTAESSWDIPPKYAGGQVAQGARLGAMGNENVMDVPFSMISYTDELIQNQQAQTIADVLANDPSIRNATGDGHMIQNFRLRGFDYNAADLATNGLFGLAPRGTTPTEMYERVEVLKGPSALFSAMAPNGAVGGVINLVPKRAGDQPLTQVTVGYFSNSQFGTAVDVGRRFGEDNAWGIRVNGAYSNGGTTVTSQVQERGIGSLALDYRGTQLKASLDAYYTNQSYNGGLANAGVAFGSATAVTNGASGAGARTLIAAGQSTAVPRAFNPQTDLFPNASGVEQSQGYIARTEYAFTDYLTGFASVGYANTYQQGYLNGNQIILAANGSGNFAAQTNYLTAYTNTVSAEAGARSRFATGEVGHDVVLQVTDLQWKNGNASVKSNYQGSNVYNPNNNLAYPAMPAYVPVLNTNTFSGVALMDTLSFLNEAVLLTLGAREQQARTTGYGTTAPFGQSSYYNQNRLSPTAGLVVKPWGPAISLYANYSQGLSVGGTVTNASATNYGQVFAPYVTTQGEAGIKWNAGSLTNTLAYFQISQPAILASGSGSNLTYSDNGNKRVQGVEWETYGELVHNLRVLGGVTYMQSSLMQTTVSGNGANQSTTSLNGNSAYGVPNWQANIGNEWDIPWALQGLTLTDRINATSSQYVNSTNTQKLPGWATLDVGARYTTSIEGKKTVFRLNVNNVFNQYYWAGVFTDGYANLGAPRTFAASATVDF